MLHGSLEEQGVWGRMYVCSRALLLYIMLLTMVPLGTHRLGPLDVTATLGVLD